MAAVWSLRMGTVERGGAMLGHRTALPSDLAGPGI